MTTYQPTTIPYPYYVQPPVRRVSAPATGVGLLAAGGAAIAGSCLTWIHAVAATGATKDFAGIAGKGDGWFTLGLGAALAVLGLVVVAKQGRLWAPIVAVVVTVFLATIVFADIGNVQRKGKSLGTLGHLDVGLGLWLVLGATALAGLSSVVALCVRRPRS